MAHDPLLKPVPKALPEPLAARLLERASELDAAHRAHFVDVAALRAAANEAGISERAFNEALAELEGHPPTAETSSKSQRPRRRGTLAAAAAAFALSALLVFRLAAPAPGSVRARSAPARAVAAGAEIVEQSYTLPCAPSADALDRIRDGLAHASSIRTRSNSPVIEIRATIAGHREIKALLARYSSDGTLSCKRE